MWWRWRLTESRWTKTILHPNGLQGRLQPRRSRRGGGGSCAPHSKSGYCPSLGCRRMPAIRTHFLCGPSVTSYCITSRLVSLCTNVDKAPRCPDVLPVRVRCRHGSHTLRWLPCHKGTCQTCQAQWRMGVADKVREGASKLQVAGRTLMFVTLTLGRPADGAAETPEQMLDRLMAAWRRWRQGRWWADNMDGAEYFRVVEAGSQNGRPHVHLVVAGRLPYIRAPHDQESVAHWRADLTGPAAREMVHGIEVAGFGPLCYVERLKGGGVRGPQRIWAATCPRAKSGWCGRTAGRCGWPRVRAGGRWTCRIRPRTWPAAWLWSLAGRRASACGAAGSGTRPTWTRIGRRCGGVTWRGGGATWIRMMGGGAGGCG